MRFGVILPAGLHDRLRHEAYAGRRPPNDIIVDALTEYFDGRPDPGGEPGLPEDTFATTIPDAPIYAKPPAPPLRRPG